MPPLRGPSVSHSQFMDSMQLDPETVDNLDMYNHIPPVLMEKCATLSVRPDTVRNLVQSMQGEGSGTPGFWGWHCSLLRTGGSGAGTAPCLGLGGLGASITPTQGVGNVLTDGWFCAGINS